jgi:hypothetical protein
MNTTKPIAFITALFMTCAASQPINPSRVCYVCGKGFRVENLDAFVTLTNELEASCDKFEKDGLNGNYGPDTCSSMMKKAFICGCEEGFRPWYKPHIESEFSAVEKTVFYHDHSRAISTSLSVLKSKEMETITRMLRGSRESKFSRKNMNGTKKRSIAVNSNTDANDISEMDNDSQNDFEGATVVSEFLSAEIVSNNSTEIMESSLKGKPLKLAVFYL